LSPQEINLEIFKAILYGFCDAGSPSVTRPVLHPGKGCPKLEELELPITENISAGVTYFSTNVS
jgi:hypothetical protein